MFFRKTWCENIEYSTSTTLILTNFVTCSYDEMLFKKIKRILSISKIYHLIIIDKHSSIHILIYLIDLLHDLLTLKLHSISSDERKTFPVKEFHALCSIYARGKISKVYIEEINETNDIEDFDYITDLCPRMKYFKVKRLNNMDIIFFLRTILKDIYNNDLSYIRSFCFHIPVADDQMTENLKQIIEYEKLLNKFTIKRILDNIYIQWT